MTHIVKRKGHKEEYDERKEYASIFAPCKNVHLNDAEAESIADKVAKEITSWIKEKTEVNYTEIFEKVSELLNKYNEDASFMYKTHLDVS